jgi:Ca2+-binding EF-hand superfamily protein
MFPKKVALSLCELLISISEEEKNIEILRQVLSEQVLFEPYAAFQRLDRNRQGYITSTDVLEYLAKNEIFHGERFVRNYVDQYDIDDDGRLSFSE